MTWAVLAGCVGLAICAAVIYWAFYVISYNMVRDAQPDAVRDRMPTGNRAFWRWLIRRGAPSKPEGS